MVVKITIIVFIASLAVVLAKPALNPLNLFASNIPGLNAAQGGLGSLSNTVGETIDSFQKLAEDGMEAGKNAAKIGVGLFTSPLDAISNIAGNFGK